MPDIIDEIDQLVDEQLAGGEPRTGYDYGNPTYPKCWHCQRHWHGLPLTQRIATMYSYGIYDETYSAADDDTPVVCQGSDFIGPMPDERRYEDFSRLYAPDGPVGNWERMTPNYRYREFFASVPSVVGQLRWWRLPQAPEGAHLQQDMTYADPFDPRGATRDHQAVTLTVGEQTCTWEGDHCRVHMSRNDNNTEWSAAIDVLADVSPDIGGTWEPLTAPGSTRHPDTPPLQQTGPAPYDYQLHLNHGDRISVAMPDGQVFTDTYQSDGQGQLGTVAGAPWLFLPDPFDSAAWFTPTQPDPEETE